MSNKDEDFGKSLLTEDDLAALRTGAQQLQWDGGLGVALGALVRACTVSYQEVPNHVLGALCATAERMREEQQGPAVPNATTFINPTAYVALPIKELFELPVGASFLVYWAKDNDPVNALRCNHDKQIIQGYDETGSILTNDGYEWQKEEGAYNDNGNVLDTGRGYAFFYKVPT